MQLSTHWNSDEFASRSRPGGPLDTPVPAHLIPSLKRLIHGVLQPLREAWGAPLIVRSGYRTPQYNELLREEARKRGRVGPAKNSQHLRATAADIVPVVASPAEVRRLTAFIEQMLRDGELRALGGLGRYQGAFVHVDVRPRRRDGTITRWGTP